MNNSIIYVNYAPYGNAGHILDYLKENFENLIYFSFIFHPVERRSVVYVYQRGNCVNKIYLPTLLVPRGWAHYFAFLLSMIVAVELLIVGIFLVLKFRVKEIIFFAPNAFLIVIGIFLKKIKIADKVIFWVWDYYPVPKRGFYRKLFYKLYAVLDEWCMRYADSVWFLSDRLKKVRGKHGTDDGRKKIVSLGMRAFRDSNKQNIKKNTLGFLGVLKKSQGLELVLNSLAEFMTAIPDFKFEVIGSGPDMKCFKKNIEDSPGKGRVKFYGFVENEEKMRSIVSGWAAALALYLPGEDNVSIYADPSKVKLYLECGIPVIITNVPYIAQEIQAQKAGCVVGYDVAELTTAAQKIFSSHEEYKKNALYLAKKYDYNAVYNQAFNDIR